MVLDLLPLHRQIRTCHGFIRSLVNDGGNTGGGSRQRRTTGDKSRFPTSTITRPAQILRVYNCIYIYIYRWLLASIFVKIETRCQTNLIAERLDAMPSWRGDDSAPWRVSWPANIAVPLSRVVAWSSTMETIRTLVDFTPSSRWRMLETLSGN